MDALGALETLLDGLRDVDARKTIVYVSNGVVFDRQIEGLLRNVGAKVAAASATFYAIQIYTPPIDATAPSVTTRSPGCACSRKIAAALSSGPI